MDADLNTIFAKLKAKGAEEACPVCAANAEFEVNYPDGVTVFLTVHDPDPDLGGASALPVVPLICRNCGYVRLHSPNHLLSDD